MKQVFFLKSYSQLSRISSFLQYQTNGVRHFAAEVKPGVKPGVKQIKTSWTKKKEERPVKKAEDEKSADFESKVLEEGTPRVKSSGPLLEEEKKQYEKYRDELKKYKEEYRHQLVKFEEIRWKAIMALPSQLREEAMKPDYTPTPESLFFWIADYTVPSTYPPTRESVLQKRTTITNYVS